MRPNMLGLPIRAEASVGGARPADGEAPGGDLDPLQDHGATVLGGPAVGANCQVT